MITTERAAALKRDALRAIAARAKNKACPGVSLVTISPHDALALLELLDEKEAREAPREALMDSVIDARLIALNLNGYTKWEDAEDIILDGHYTLKELKAIVAIAEGEEP